jgi:hypothetical protein
MSATRRPGEVAVEVDERGAREMPAAVLVQTRRPLQAPSNVEEHRRALCVQSPVEAGD